MKLFGNILKVVAFLFVVWLAWYFGMPTTSTNFTDYLTCGFLLGALGTITFLPFRAMIGRTSAKPNYLTSIIFGSITGISLVILLFAGLGSTPLFREGWYDAKPNSFRNLLGNVVDTCEITSDVSPIDPAHAVIMDDTYALKLAEKRLTAFDKSLGSQTTLGAPTQVKVDFPDGRSNMYYIVPVEHSGFWKWQQNKTTPGYILVNAQNENDVRMVNEANGKKLNMRYLRSACWSDYLMRYIYMNGYSNLGLAHVTMEVDDNLYPYQVITTYENTIGFSGENATGVITVDPVSGEIKKYSIKDAPKWIDRIQPVEFVSRQIDHWGRYVHGCWANWSGKDQVMPTEETSFVYGSDGICYLYIGVTSVGSDEASAGFFLVNSRDKTAKFYKMVGATEAAAMKSALGAVGEINPNLDNVTHPRPYNLSSQFTYVMAHKDADGLIKAISLVNYQDYQIASVGTNMREAIADYNKKLREKNVLTNNGSKGVYDVTSTITRIRVATENTYFMIGDFNKIFISSNTNPELYVTNLGDKVRIKFENNTGKEIYLDYFDNLEIISDSATALDKYFQEFNDSVTGERFAKDYDARYKNLSEEEKYKAKNLKTNTSQNPDDVKLSKKEKAEKENAFKRK